MPATDAPALIDQATRLRAAVAGHKAAIRRHRDQLSAAKSALVDLEARCRELGIGLTVQEHHHGSNRFSRSADHADRPDADL